MEIFRDVVGYEDLFQVSNLGRVFSKRTNKVLKQFMLKTGYSVISTKVGGRQGKGVCLRVHRLVACAFIDNPHSKSEVNHKDGVKSNNHADNLEWVTPKENMQHAFSTGLAKATKGSDNTQSKLSPTDIDLILKLYVPYSSTNGCSALAKVFGVHHTQISRVTRGVRNP